MEIKAADVMKLRHATNAGMMDCKKALQEAEGDFDKAVDIIRKSKRGLRPGTRRGQKRSTRQPELRDRLRCQEREFH